MEGFFHAVVFKNAYFTGVKNNMKTEDTIYLLEKNMGYKYKNINLLKTALTHTSYANEHRIKKELSNERLEFLGDAIVDFVVGEKLFLTCPEKPEGDLSKMRAAIVCEQGLKDAADSISLGEHILLGKGEEITGGRERASIVSDAFEAVVASIYLDSGMERAREWVLKMLSKPISDAERGKYNKDFKTALQEFVQRDGGHISYEVISQSGPEHDKVFEVMVLINDKSVCEGKGKSKKEAEQQAAKKALEMYGEI